MPLKRPILRVFSIFLICSLFLPSLAYSLRMEQTKDSPAGTAQLTAGMEEEPADSELLALQWKEFLRSSKGMFKRFHGNWWTAFVGYLAKEAPKKAALRLAGAPPKGTLGDVHIPLVRLFDDLDELTPKIAEERYADVKAILDVRIHTVESIQAAAEDVVAKVRGSRQRKLALKLWTGTPREYRFALDEFKKKLKGWRDRFQELSAGMEEVELQRYLEYFHVDRRLTAWPVRVHPSGAGIILKVQAKDGRYFEGFMPKSATSPYYRNHLDELAREASLPVRVIEASVDPGRKKLLLKFSLIREEKREEDSFTREQLEAYRKEFLPGTVLTVRPKRLHESGRGLIVQAEAKDGELFDGFIPNNLAVSYKDRLPELANVREIRVRVIKSEIAKKENKLHVTYGFFDPQAERFLETIRRAPEEIQVRIAHADKDGLHGEYAGVPVFVPMSTVDPGLTGLSFEDWAGIEIEGKIIHRDTESLQMRASFVTVVSTPEDEAPPGRFETVEEFLERHLDSLGPEGLDRVEALMKRKVPVDIWLFPSAVVAHRQVRVYIQVKDGQDQGAWITAAQERLNREGERLKGVLFFAEAYPADGILKTDLPAIVLRQEGAGFSSEVSVPVITISSLPEMGKLVPGWVYALAFTRALRGVEIGPVLDVIEVSDGYAVFV